MDALIPVFDKNAAYIWACYGLAALGVGGVLAVTLWQARSARRALEHAEKQAQIGVDQKR